MKWLKDLWHGKPTEPHVFLKLTPDRPHQGIDHFSAQDKCPYKNSIQVMGVSSDQARLELVGKVLDWTRLTDKQWKAIEGGRPPKISHEELKALFR